MRGRLPLAICFLSGLFIFLQYFSPHPVLNVWKATLFNWVIIIGTFAYGLGILSLWMVHVPKVKRMAPGWGYSAVTLVSLVVTVVVAMIWGKSAGTPFTWLYNNVQNPIQGTMFALLAFFIASAAYRAFRARSILATVLLVAAVIVMLGRVPLGSLITGGYSNIIADWLINIPNLAAKRAINVGVGFGGAAVALKVLVGIERSYLGSGR